MEIFAILHCILIMSHVDTFCGLITELIAGEIYLEFRPALDPGSSDPEQCEALRHAMLPQALSLHVVIKPDAFASIVGSLMKALSVSGYVLDLLQEVQAHAAGILRQQWEAQGSHRGMYLRQEN